MQKLVTIYLDSGAYSKLMKSSAKDHGHVEEHLDEYLKEGWRITSVASFGSSGRAYSICGWVVAVLEKD